MIKECNFKQKITKGDRKGRYICQLSISLLASCCDYTTGVINKSTHTECYDFIHPKECVGEDNCILFQIYKSLSNDIDYSKIFEKGFERGKKKLKLPKKLPIDTIDGRLGRL